MSRNDLSDLHHEASAITDRPVVSIEEPAPVSPGDPAGAAVRRAIASGLRALLANEPAAVVGDPVGVHQMRTAARRLRGLLRAYHPLLESDWVRSLAGELRWLGEILGAVRDLDVLRAGLINMTGDLKDALGPLFATIDEQHDAARALLRETLLGDRYRCLLERLADSARTPRLTEDAGNPCCQVLPPLVARLWQSLKTRGRSLQPDDAHEAFHAVRIRAKRVRYAAEAMAELLDASKAKAAARFARRAKRIQDLLGRHQDAVVASAAIERMAAECHQDVAFLLAVGRLLERQAQAAQRARAKFRRAWRKLDRKKIRSWMKKSSRV